MYKHFKTYKSRLGPLLSQEPFLNNDGRELLGDDLYQIFTFGSRIVVSDKTN